jgi:hypothetical protein
LPLVRGCRTQLGYILWQQGLEPPDRVTGLDIPHGCGFTVSISVSYLLCISYLSALIKCMYAVSGEPLRAISWLP